MNDFIRSLALLVLGFWALNMLFNAGYFYRAHKTRKVAFYHGDLDRAVIAIFFGLVSQIIFFYLTLRSANG